jgi:phosphohistidine phosphatase SixA
VRLLLVHHGDAVGPDVDPQRPLSSRGLAGVDALVDRFLAECAKNADIGPCAPEVIWHSGKLRARQTAEAFLRASPFAEFKAVRGLRPDDPPEIILETIAHETRDIALVSHMPLLPAIRARLGAGQTTFPPHGLVLLDEDAGVWREVLVLDGGL